LKMQSGDSLQQLLRRADQAVGLPVPAPDLAANVRRRRAEQLVQVRRVKIGASAAAIGLVLVGSFLVVRQNELSPNRPAADEIARLSAQSDVLAREASALQHQIVAAKAEQSRQDLRDEYRRQLAANVENEIAESPIDRAAAIALCQGDYYW